MRIKKFNENINEDALEYLKQCFVDMTDEYGVYTDDIYDDSDGISISYIDENDYFSISTCMVWTDGVSFGYKDVKVNCLICHTFQVPFKDFNDAEIVAKELVTELNKIYNNPICIVIAEGTIKPNYKDPLMSDGTAYHRSGKYIDDPNKCLDMIRNGEYIKVL